MNLSLVLGGLLAAAAPALPSVAAPSSPGAGVYLDPSVTGASYCFDPDSPVLRASFSGKPLAPQASVDSAALADDVAFLHQLLRTTYSGWPELLQHRTFDPDRYFEAWRAKVAAAGPSVSVEEGVIAPTVDILRALTDSHFGPEGLLITLANDSRLAFHEYQAEPPAGLKLETCDAHSVPGVRADTLRVARVLRADGSRGQRLTVSAVGAGETLTLRCGEKALELKPRLALPRPPDPGGDVYTYQPLGDVGIITLRNFKGPPDYPRHRRHKLLVFDLRGNTGGNDGFVYEWLDQAVRGPWFGSGEISVQGAFSRCFIWNLLVRRQLKDGRIDQPEAVAERQALRAKWPAPPEPSRHVFDSGKVEGHAKAPFTGRILVCLSTWTTCAVRWRGCPGTASTPDRSRARRVPGHPGTARPSRRGLGHGAPVRIFSGATAARHRWPPTTGVRHEDPHPWKEWPGGVRHWLRRDGALSRHLQPRQ